MDSRMFDGIGTLITMLFVVCCVFVPFGLWKLIEIVAWLFRHVTIA